MNETGDHIKTSEVFSGYFLGVEGPEQGSGLTYLKIDVGEDTPMRRIPCDHRMAAHISEDIPMGTPVTLIKESKRDCSYTVYKDWLTEAEVNEIIKST